MAEAKYGMYEDQPTYLLLDPERRDIFAWNDWYAGYISWRTKRAANDWSFWSRSTIWVAFADLRGADLSGANLFSIRIGASMMAGANLSGANLHSAEVTNVDLCGANLSGADLGHANLRGTVLTEAVLDGAIWDDETWWPDGFTPPKAQP